MNKCVAFVFILSLFYVGPTNAQDTLYFKNTDTVLGKVDLVFETEVVYRKWNNLEGPKYRVSANSLHKIILDGGEVVIFKPPVIISKTRKKIPQDYDYYMNLHKKRLSGGFAFLGLSTLSFGLAAASIYGIKNGNPDLFPLYLMGISIVPAAFVSTTIIGSFLLDKSFRYLKRANGLKNLSLAPNFYPVAHTNSFNGGISVAYRF